MIPFLAFSLSSAHWARRSRTGFTQVNVGRPRLKKTVGELVLGGPGCLLPSLFTAVQSFPHSRIPLTAHLPPPYLVIVSDSDSHQIATPEIVPIFDVSLTLLPFKNIPFVSFSKVQWSVRQLIGKMQMHTF